MITICQVILGQIPPYLQPCVDSVKTFAWTSGYNYKTVIEFPEWAKAVQVPDDSEYMNFLLNRTVSEWIRFDLLSSQKNTLVIDWDIFLFNSFIIPDVNKTYFSENPIECMIYNGEQTGVFANMRELAGDRLITKPGQIDLGRGVNKYIDTHSDFKHGHFDHKTYIHLDNCRLARDYHR